MAKLFVSVHPSGGALFEDAPPSDRYVELDLPEADMQTLQALVQIESYAVTKACGALRMSGVALGHRQDRRGLQPAS